MALTQLDGDAARRWTAAATDSLAAAATRIDALNVFPVPDGDTGTNMHLTLRSARAGVEALPAGARLHQVADAAARGALLGARGNSGVITAQLLRGWAVELSGLERAGPKEVRRALARADEMAWQAVAEPVEGTILSATRAAARAARRARGRLPEVVTAAAEAARTALARTPSQLARLREAGVVDAGAAGVVLMMEALAGVVTGRDEPVPASGPVPPPSGQGLVGGATAQPGCHGPSRADGFEVMYLLDGSDDAVTRLRGELTGLGESVVVVGGEGFWNVHVHTADAGAALEAGVRAGRPHEIRVSALRTVASASGGRTAPTGPSQGGEVQGREVQGGAVLGRETSGREPTGTAPSGSAQVGVVAWAAGPGLAEAFASAGAVPVDAGPQRPATGAVLAAVRAAGTRDVVVLPNDRETLAVAEAAAETARAEGIRVVVVPTRAQVQGLAAAAVHDPGRDLASDVAQMSAAAGAARHGGVTVATRDAITMAGPCRAGDVLGALGGDFAVVGATLAEVAREVVDRLLAGGGEMLTLVLGADAPAGLAEAVAAPVRRRRPDVEVVVLDGGQPRYPLLVGVE